MITALFEFGRNTEISVKNEKTSIVIHQKPWRQIHEQSHRGVTISDVGSGNQAKASSNDRKLPHLAFHLESAGFSVQSSKCGK